MCRATYHKAPYIIWLPIMGRFVMWYHDASDIQLQLEGYRLTTAEIIYCLPDYPDLLQTFIWQNLDISPDYPRLRTFLMFWQTNIEGRLFSVRVAQRSGIAIPETRIAQGEFILH